MTGGAAAEARMTNRYKLSKQADVPMLFYLFFAADRLGYTFDPGTIPRTSTICGGARTA